MKRHKLPGEIRKSTGEDIKREVDLSFNMVNALINMLVSKGISQKDLANRLQKKESKISKWLSGGHNFTFRTIAKIESALTEKLTHAPTMNNKNIGEMNKFWKSYAL